MTLKGVPAFTMIAIVGLGVQVEAQTPCAELVRLRSAATEEALEQRRQLDLEIARLANNPDFPERGRLELKAAGGK